MATHPRRTATDAKPAFRQRDEQKIGSEPTAYRTAMRSRPRRPGPPHVRRRAVARGRSRRPATASARAKRRQRRRVIRSRHRRARRNETIAPEAQTNGPPSSRAAPIRPPPRAPCATAATPHNLQSRNRRTTATQPLRCLPPEPRPKRQPRTAAPPETARQPSSNASSSSFSCRVFSNSFSRSGTSSTRRSSPDTSSTTCP